MDAESILNLSEQDLEALLCGEPDEEETIELGINPAKDKGEKAQAGPRFTPAIDAALQTTEILEAILVRVEMRTLLFAQRVNHKFRAVIQKSPTLRKALWLDADDTLPSCDPNYPHVNPLLAEKHLRTGVFREFCWTPKVENGNLPVIFKNLDHLQLRAPGSWEDMILLQPNPFSRHQASVAYENRGAPNMDTLAAFYVLSSTGRISIGTWKSAPMVREIMEAVIKVLRMDPWRV